MRPNRSITVRYALENLLSAPLHRLQIYYPTLLASAVQLTAHYFDSDIEVRQSLIDPFNPGPRPRPHPRDPFICLLHLVLNLITNCIEIPISNKNKIHESFPCFTSDYSLQESPLELTRTLSDPRLDHAFWPCMKVKLQFWLQTGIPKGRLPFSFPLFLEACLPPYHSSSRSFVHGSI